LPFAPQKGNAPPEQAVHPLKPFSIKTQYLFQKFLTQTPAQKAAIRVRNFVLSR